MNTRYVVEAVVMMLLGIAGAWAFDWGSPLIKVGGALYGFLSYVAWRIIVDWNDKVLDGPEDPERLSPLQAVLALGLPAGAVVGLIVLAIIGLVGALFVPSNSRAHY